MKIQLDQTEIEQAIKAYINEQVSIKPGQKIELAFTAGRGERGLTVDVDITADTSATVLTGNAQPQTAAAPTGPIKREAEVTPAKPEKVERVNGRVVTSTVAKPAADDGIATASDDVGLTEAQTADVGEKAPFEGAEEAAPAAEEGRAGKSIFASI